MKILIIGFPRSGTSLTFRIFHDHLDIHKSFYESLILWRHSKEAVETEFGVTDDVGCVNKIIYQKPFVGSGITQEFSYINYCDLWNERYGDKAKIIQIVRHPYDQWNSIIGYRYQKENVNYNQPLYQGGYVRDTHKMIINLRRYFSCVPEYTEKIMSYPNSLSIKYEDLVDHPESTIKKLYEFSNLDPSRSKFKERVRKRKRFYYKESGHLIDNEPSLKEYRKKYWKVMNENIKRVLDAYNKIEGPKYEV
jgi:hypothetical protein